MKPSVLEVVKNNLSTVAGRAPPLSLINAMKIIINEKKVETYIQINLRC